MNVSTLIFDADDTLWDEQIVLQSFENRIASILTGHGEDASAFRERFERAEEENIPIIGYGFPSYTYSLVEAVMTEKGYMAAKRDILEEFKILYDAYAHHSPKVFEGVSETLAALSDRGYSLHVLSRGIPSEQKHKLELSGLRDQFQTVTIVQSKIASTYSTLCEGLGIPQNAALMVGNSMRSDILPAREAGCQAVWIPSATEWSHDRSLDTANIDFVKISKFPELLQVLS